MSKIRAFCHVFGKNRNHAGFQVRAVVRMMDNHIYFLRPCQVFIAVKINFFLHGTPPNKHYEYLGANILLMRLTVRRIIDKIRTGERYGFQIPRYIFKDRSDGGWQSRSIGFFVPPPIPVGGASYAVTHSRRKYHYACMWFIARCSAIATLRRWPCSLRPPGVWPPFTGEYPCVPAVWLRTYRMYPIALFSCYFQQADSRPL